ncbi:MAG: PEP-CTERM sorting domain-containing protein [Bryobacteraceae bacterium]
MSKIVHQASCLRLMPALAGLLILLTPAVHAGNISFVDIFGNISYVQTGDGNALSLNGTFFSLDLNSSTPNAYTSASVSYPGPDSPQALPQSSPTDYGFQTGLLPDLATLEAAYPFGTYSFQGMNGPDTDTATLTYSADDYSQSNPFLTGTDYSSLQGMNPTQAFTFHFSPYVTGPNATEGDIFFTISDVTTGQTVFTTGGLPSTTTSVVLPANVLAHGDLFDYELDYSNRDFSSDTGGANFPPFVGFDTRADGEFTTSAAPEPGGLAMLAIAGFAGLFMLKRRAKIAA